MDDGVKSFSKLDSAINCSEYKRSFTWPKSINTITQTVSLNQNKDVGDTGIRVHDNNSVNKISLQSDCELKAPFLGKNSFLNKPKTEYRKKFQPFSNYIYITGLGWKKHKDASKLEQKPKEIRLEWYNEVEERNKKATEFRNRSQLGHPVTSIDRLEKIYKQSCGPLWIQTKERDIAALALDTSQLRLHDSFSKVQKSSKPKHRVAALVSPPKERIATRKGTKFASFNNTCNNCQCSSLDNDRTYFGTSEPGRLWMKAGSSKLESLDSLNDLNQPTKPYFLEQSSIDVILDGPVKTTEIKSPSERADLLRLCSPNQWTVKMDDRKDLHWTEDKDIYNLLIPQKMKHDNPLVNHPWLMILFQILALIFVYKAVQLASTLN